MKYNPFSVSKFGVFNTCPKKFKLQYIDKIRIESEPQLALFRGSYAHEILEHNFDYNIPVTLNEVFTQEEADKVIDMIKKFRCTELGKNIDKLINHKNSIKEEDFAFDTKMNLVNFWNKSAWLRGSADLYNINISQPTIIDYKTGKDKSKDEDFGYEQGMMYAIYMFIRFPELKEITAVFVFVEHSTKKEILYTRDNFTSYIKLFYNKTKKIECTDIFKENISALCEYCDFNGTEWCTSYQENEEKTQDILYSKVSLDF